MLFALGKDALPPPNYSRDLPHPVSYLLSVLSLVGFLSYPEFLHCMKYVNRARRVDLAAHLPRPPASHHCNCTTPTDVASPDTLFRAQEAVSLSLQVQPTSFYISTRPPLPASALLWLSNPVPPRDRIKNSFVI